MVGLVVAEFFQITGVDMLPPDSPPVDSKPNGICPALLNSTKQLPDEPPTPP